MSKRNVFTTITPLPASVTRQTVIDFLHDHEEMIDLNPLVKERHPIPAPPHAPAEEVTCHWYSLTDKISYLPGIAGDVTYTCAFNDMPNGLQTHCYAPAGLTIRDKWTVGGSLPGEPPQPLELGLRAPPVGLYLREDVDMRCNVIMASFVKKTLKRSHAALVERLKFKAQTVNATGSGRGNRNGTGVQSALSPDLKKSPPIGSNVLNSHPYQHLSASAPRSRSNSAASSVVSNGSSLYSQPWSSPATSTLASSRGTSPALSSKSAQMTPSNSPPSQPQTAQPAYTAPAQPNPLPPTIPELPSISAIVLEPETPFLTKRQPDWPLKPEPEPLPSWPLKSQPSWPLKAPATSATLGQQRPRPQSQLAFSAYRPPSKPATELHIADSSRSSSRTLSDDALWQALGGGRFAAAAAAAKNGNGSGHGNGNGTTAMADLIVQINDMSYNHQHQQPRARAATPQGHPDYPQMSPYAQHDGGEETTQIGLGLVGRRPVSMAVSPVGGAFVAQLE